MYVLNVLKLKFSVYLTGIKSIMVALMAQKAEVSYDTCHTTPLEIAAAIQDLGFNATVMQEQEGSKEGLIELHVSQTWWRSMV